MPATMARTCVASFLLYQRKENYALLGPMLIGFFSFFFLLASGATSCGQKSLLAYSNDPMTYESPGYSNEKAREQGEYSTKKSCQVLFEAYHYDHIVKIHVKLSKMERWRWSGCFDKVLFYDGPTTEAELLGEFCGLDTPTFVSSGSTILVQFDINYQGFTLEYWTIDENSESSSSVGAGTIVAVTIPAVLIYGVVFYILYRRCKYAQRVRRNLAASGHTPEDLQNAMVSVFGQASQGQPIRPNQAYQACNNGTGSPGPIDVLLSHSKSSRPQTSTSAAGDHRRPGRVRHPAGDVHNHQRHQHQHHHHHRHPLDTNRSDHSHLRLSHPDHHNISDDGYSGYGSDRGDPLLTTPGFIRQSHEGTELFPDASGVFYAGDMDEHGVLHPPNEQSHSPYPPAPTPSIVSSRDPSGAYIGHGHLEDDRRSRGSNRITSYSSGRNSPREGGSSGRGSPYRHRSNHSSSPRPPLFLDSEGHTLTYYGMIDGVNHNIGVAVDGGGGGGGSHDASAPTLSEDMLLSDPPPSYEDAATGKYAP